MSDGADSRLVRITRTLEAPRGGRTMMTLHQTVPESVAKRTGAYPSWVEMLERLSEEVNR